MLNYLQLVRCIDSLIESADTGLYLKVGYEPVMSSYSKYDWQNVVSLIVFIILINAILGCLSETLYSS